MRRRELIQWLAAAPTIGLLQGCDTGAAATRETVMTPDPRVLQKFGLQLSTITPMLMADFEGTLARVAEIGYQQVEFSALGFLGRPIATVSQLLADSNLEAPVGRISPKLPEGFANLPREEQRAAFRTLAGPEHLLANVEYGLEAARELGQRHLVLPALMPDNFATASGVEASIDLLRRAGEVCARAGIQFGYHNHNWEFGEVDGIVPYDLMLERIEPELMAFQLDVYWVTKGGRDPLHYLSNYPGRFPSSHLKDITSEGDFEDVGYGEIDMPEFVRAAEDSGTEYFFVERDNPPEPMRTAERTHAFLKQMRY